MSVVSDTLVPTAAELSGWTGWHVINVTAAADGVDAVVQRNSSVVPLVCHIQTNGAAPPPSSPSLSPPTSSRCLTPSTRPSTSSSSSATSTQQRAVVLKRIDLRHGKFRNREHHLRTRRSHHVEAAFYKRFGCHLIDVSGCGLPALHAEHWWSLPGESDAGHPKDQQGKHQAHHEDDTQGRCKGRSRPARLPTARRDHMANADADLGVLVLADVRTQPGVDAVTNRSVEQILLLDPDTHALRALDMLARFHAAMGTVSSPTGLSGAGGIGAGGGQRRPADDDSGRVSCQHPAATSGTGSGTDAFARCFWERGGYWSLDKRREDVDGMAAAWEGICNTFGDALPWMQTAAVRLLGAKLAEHAGALDAWLCRQCQGTTVLHGDYKTANLFFHGGSRDPAVSMVDFQWAGPGLCAQDVVYFLWSSVPAAGNTAQHSRLLKAYHTRLAEHTKQLRPSLPWGVEVPSFETFHVQCRVAFLDYTRFLIGSMWGASSPQRCEELAHNINRGLHCRSLSHFEAMVRAACDDVTLLQQL